MLNRQEFSVATVRAVHSARIRRSLAHNRNKHGWMFYMKATRMYWIIFMEMERTWDTFFHSNFLRKKYSCRNLLLAYKTSTSCREGAGGQNWCGRVSRLYSDSLCLTPSASSKRFHTFLSIKLINSVKRTFKEGKAGELDVGSIPTDLINNLRQFHSRMNLEGKEERLSFLVLDGTSSGLFTWYPFDSVFA